MTESVVTVLPFAPSPQVGHHLAELLRRELPALTDQLVEEIQQGVLAYGDRRPGVTRRVRRAVRTALDLLVQVVEEGGPVPEAELKAFQQLAQGEYLRDRGVNALQSAYRIGARAIWHRFSETAQQADVPPEEMYRFAEVLFTSTEAVSAYSVQAYEQLQSENLQNLQRRRRRLLELLVSDSEETTKAVIWSLARQTDWQLPETVACIAVAGSRQQTQRIAPTIHARALADLDRPDPFVLMPDPQRPGRLELLGRALYGLRFAIGPTVPLAEASLSLRMARNALSLARQGAIPDEQHIRCEDHMPELLLFDSDGIMRILARRSFSNLPDLSPGQRERLPQTLLAWLTTGGSVPETAARLMIHPQTVRYRMRQLEAIFGELLHDHDWRFEMQLVLRAEILAKSAGR